MEEPLQEASAGFPSPAENWRERPLRLQELLVRHPDATYYVRVRGHSMREAGIHEGDVLVVDRAVQAESGDLVVVAFERKHLVKRLEYVGEQTLLCSAHPDVPPLLVARKQVEIWGVVIAIVRRLRRRKRASLRQDEHE